MVPCPELWTSNKTAPWQQRGLGVPGGVARALGPGSAVISPAGGPSPSEMAGRVRTTVEPLSGLGQQSSPGERNWLQKLEKSSREGGMDGLGSLATQQGRGGLLPPSFPGFPPPSHLSPRRAGAGRCHQPRGSEWTSLPPTTASVLGGGCTPEEGKAFQNRETTPEPR